MPQLNISQNMFTTSTTGTGAGAFDQQQERAADQFQRDNNQQSAFGSTGEQPLSQQPSSRSAPAHHIHRDNEPIGQKQYDPSSAPGFSQTNVDSLPSNQTTDYRPDVDRFQSSDSNVNRLGGDFNNDNNNLFSGSGAGTAAGLAGSQRDTDLDRHGDFGSSTGNNDNNEFGRDQSTTGGVDTGEQRKGGFGQRVSGKMEEMTGKMMNNPLKQAAGLEKQSGATKKEDKAERLEQRAQDVRHQAAEGWSLPTL